MVRMRSPVRLWLAAPKNKALLWKCFIFIQSEGLACNRRQAYVIRLLRKRYVIKALALYVFSFGLITYRLRRITFTALPPMTAMLSAGMSVEDILKMALEGFDFDMVDSYDPAYRCTCSRDKVTRAFCAMSPADLRTLPDEQGKVEVTCSFCDNVYTFTDSEIQQLANRK